MISFFKSRNQWAAIIVSLIFSPVGGLLYLGKGRKAVIFFTLAILAIIGAFILYTQGIKLPKLAHQIQITQFAVHFIGTAYCYFVAKAKDINPNKWYARWYNVILLSTVIPLALAYSFRTFVYEPFDLPSKSMSPTLKKWDYFLVEKFGNRNFKRGEIIVFNFKDPSYGWRPFVKRIIGMPGDKILYDKGVLTLNGKPIEQICQAEIEGKALCTEKLPGGTEYQIVNGFDENFDHLTLNYVVPEDSYFILGDNRPNSTDSRFHQIGYVKNENVKGRVKYNFRLGKDGSLDFMKF